MAQQRPQPGQAPFNFPSPNIQQAHPDAFQDAVVHAKNAMRAYEPAVLRQAIRELWELTLVGSEYHNSFICSTMLHRAPPATLSRSIELHGARAVTAATSEIAKHLTKEGLDLVAPILLPKLSPVFLDKALALRLESIQAQQLVNALGRAERLGYDVRDMVTGTGTGTGNHTGPPRQEKVIPTANPIPAPSASMPPWGSQAAQRSGSGSRPAPSGAVLLPSDQEIMNLGIAFCENCNRPCAGFKALLAHRRSGLCGRSPAPLDRLGKEYCLFCGQHFTGNGGLTYHVKNNVCGSYTSAHTDALTRLFTDAHQVWKTKQSQTNTSNVEAPIISSQFTPQQSQGSGTPKPDPYSGLDASSRLAFDAAMARIEYQYHDGQRKAANMPPLEQKAELARLKNLYNNKQSTTRKRFGIRLRERRSKHEIDEERSRMLSARPETPGSTGYRRASEVESPASTRKRAFSQVDGASVSAGDRDSVGGQRTPKWGPATEAGSDVPASPATGATTGPTSKMASPVISQPKAPLTTSVTPQPNALSSTGATPQPSALSATGATPRPIPMSIAGSYTAPIRTAAKETEAIEIDDDDDDEEEEDDDDDDDGEEEGTDNDDHSDTEMGG
ncbi:hypothetical protein BBO_03540 [Beauveria brongniartii RCEF 3172]|uniref:Uncharacterized protein n=1 Tax=Beauveria brongniartii RCEF 3172 TaxID=1081107 RepID=A0A167FY00_9HYPO|nr:hypothetical protein BBO_03540 [Beauveria brongniartii RCEF 3172]